MGYYKTIFQKAVNDGQIPNPEDYHANGRPKFFRMGKPKKFIDPYKMSTSTNRLAPRPKN